MSNKVTEESPNDLNAKLNFWTEDGKIDFDADKEAARQYHLQYVNQKTQYFPSLEDKMDFLITNEYYEPEVFSVFTMEQLKELHRHAHSFKHRFDTYLGPVKFYGSYALKTFDGAAILERFEDRVVANAVGLSDGDFDRAKSLVEEIITGRLQPATPTFANIGKKQRGELVSCFPGWELVDTINGRVRIEDIQVGDKVLTHTGKYKKVTEKIVNKNQENLVHIAITGSSNGLTVTKDHPILVVAMEGDDRESIISTELPSNNFKWVRAGDVHTSDYVVMASPKEESDKNIYDLLMYLPQELIGQVEIDVDGRIKKVNTDKKYRSKERYSARFKNTKRFVTLDEDFGRFCGYYLSEGYVQKRYNDGRKTSVIFTFGAKEDAFIQDLIELSESIFGVTPTVNINSSDNSARVGINSAIVAEFIFALFGTGFDTKSLSKDILLAAPDFIQGVLVGLFRGDGCTTSGGMVCALVNVNLIHDLKLASTKLDLLPYSREYINQAGNSTANLSITGFPGNNEEFVYSVGKNLRNYIGVGSRYVNSTHMIDGIPTYRVKDISQSDIVDTVYNLEVEDDHTYSVNGFIVHNCFILDVQDNMESIGRVVVSALQLSKRGGGVGINVNNIREYGAPIKKIKGQSSGVIPVCKMLDDAFTYANQLGSRQGAGAVYISVHHPDLLALLDSKRENADEKVRLKTLSVGLTVTDVAYQKAREDDCIYQFSPYDVEREYGLPFSKVDITTEYDNLVDNPKITKKKVRARDLFRIIAELQFQSGYPYIMNIDTVNETNPIDGTVDISNLCVTGDTEILTSNGYRKVKDLYDSQEDFDVVVDTRARDMDLDKLGTSVEKSTKMFKTAENANILKMTTVEGHELRATDWHKMYVVRDKELIKIPLNEVVPGDKVLVQSDEGAFGSIEEENLATVSEIVADGVEDVYDVTVENGNSVIFNGIATGNCSEILQVTTPSVLNDDVGYEEVGRDISCNLASLNIKKAMDGGNLGKTVEAAIRMLTNVSDRTSIDAVPSVREGNNKSHSVGLGQFSLHEFFLQEGMAYGDEDSLNFTNNYFMAINYYALKTSNAIARERGETFFEFEKSKYASAQYLIDRYAQDDMINPNNNTLDIFNKYGMTLPTFEDWERLAFDIEEYGLYNAYLQAVPPTGSISYINGGTSSIHPAVALIEARKEGKIGRVYYPTPGVTNDNYHEFEDAYQIGPFKIIDVYAEAQKHVDQGMSLTLFYKETDTTRTLNRAYAYSHHKKVKTLYYARVRSENLEGTNIEECVSCTL